MTLQQEEEGASRRYAALSALADAAISRQDTALLPGLLKSAEVSHTKLHKVRENVRSTLAAQGLLVPRAEAFRVAEITMRRLRHLVMDAPQDVLLDVEALEPENVTMVQAALEEWSRVTLAEIAETVHGLERAFPLATDQALVALGFEIISPVNPQEDVP